MSEMAVEQMVSRVIRQVVKISSPEGSHGSGMVVHGDLILTALHVVDGAPGLFVRFYSGEAIEADCVAAAPTTDLALLRLRQAPRTLLPEQLDAILLEEEKLEPGEIMIAIGHPLGLDWSVTGGHFNAIRAPGEEPLTSFGIDLACPLVQVDTTINPGNSGGPILDLAGRLAGIADSMINPGIANNIGFAIHVSTALSFVEANRQRMIPLVPYNDGHHYPADTTFSPLTGKPISPVPLVRMPEGGGVRYSCGHLHAPGLQHCPYYGKPVKSLENAPRAPLSTSGATSGSPDMPVNSQTCSNCKAALGPDTLFCPRCGKPRPA